MKLVKTIFLAASLLLLLFGTRQAFAGPRSDRSIQIDPGSEEGQNVQAAADFIRSMGDTEHTINANIIHFPVGKDKGKPFDPEENFSLRIILSPL